jgi:hypothetical protein
MTADEASAPHKTRDALAPTARPRRSKLRLDPRDTVRATARLVKRADLLDQVRIGVRSR